MPVCRVRLTVVGCRQSVVVRLAGWPVLRRDVHATGCGRWLGVGEPAGCLTRQPDHGGRSLLVGRVEAVKVGGGHQRGDRFAVPGQHDPFAGVDHPVDQIRELRTGLGHRGFVCHQVMIRSVQNVDSVQEAIMAGRSVLPNIVERTSRGEYAVDPYSKLFSERIVFLGTAVDDTTANDLVSQLLYLDYDKPERDISLYINSPGGS